MIDVYDDEPISRNEEFLFELVKDCDLQSAIGGWVVEFIDT